LEGVLVSIMSLTEKQGGRGALRRCTAVAAAAFLYASSAYAGGWVTETQPDAPGAELCKSLLHRLNSLGDCAADALETYQEFSTPPWKPLDPAQHIDLIARLLGAQGAAPAAAMRLTGEILEDKRQGARDFARNGGVLQMWETRLLSNFGGRDRPAPAGPQTVVQLITKSGAPLDVVHMNTAMGALDFPSCPGTATKGWIKTTFLVTPDLRGLDLRVEQGIAAALALHPPMLYKGRVLFVGQTDVFEDIPGLGLTGGLCSFRRASGKR